MIELKRPIAAYYSACNSQNFTAVVALFVEGATVEDEGRTHRGATEIRLWAEKTQEEYRFTLTPLETRQEGDTVTVSTNVSGTFPGSPIDLNFVFRLNGDKISALTIRDQQ
jgi:hypothetical protein